MQILSGVTCGDPTPSIRDQFGEVVDYRPGPYYVGHNFTFSCPQGYNLLGSERRTCMNNGRWSGHNTICDPIGKFKLYDGERCESISSLRILFLAPKFSKIWFTQSNPGLQNGFVNLLKLCR